MPGELSPRKGYAATIDQREEAASSFTSTDPSAALGAVGGLVAPGSASWRSADRVEKTLGKASKSISKAVDAGDYDTIQDAITKAGGKVEDSLES